MHPHVKIIFTTCAIFRHHKATPGDAGPHRIRLVAMPENAVRCGNSGPRIAIGIARCCHQSPHRNFGLATPLHARGVATGIARCCQLETDDT
jgi:hypothetical protein